MTPVFGLVYFFVMVVLAFPFFATQGRMFGGDLYMLAFQLLFVFWPIMMVVTYGLVVFYIVHIARSDTLTGGQTGGWILFLFFAGAIAVPVYWYLFIREPPLEVEILSVDQLDIPDGTQSPFGKRMD